MKLQKLFDAIIAQGIALDPRGKKQVMRELKALKKRFEKLSQQEQKYFDRARLDNPYSDSRLLHGDADVDVKTIMVGIDIDVGELVLADYLRSKGTPIDLVVAHHPEGIALAGLYDVMHMQCDIVRQQGVTIAAAEHLMSSRIGEVERRLLPTNHTKSADAARLLNMPFLCAHTPADNQVSAFLQNLFDTKEPETLGDILELLMDIPEYQHAARQQAGPKIFNGQEKNRSGKIFVDMTGGTEGSREIFQSLANAGVSTVVGMHLSEDHLKKAKEAKINVVIAGHISSDNIGVNLLLDSLEKKERFTVIECSGFLRVKRT